MKDDGPSPRVRISLTAASHRPRQFEHEITGPTEARVVACAGDAAGWINEIGSSRRARWAAGAGEGEGRFGRGNVGWNSRTGAKEARREGAGWRETERCNLLTTA